MQALKNVSFQMTAGETLALVGGSGCGKSTLAKLISGLLTPDSGTLLWEGQPMDRWRRLDRARRIQMIFRIRSPHSTPSYRLERSCAKSCDLAAEPRRRKTMGRCEELLEGCGAVRRTRLPSYPFQFSGGQRQRIAIARALAMKPSLLIADEPLSALDVTIQARILDLLRDLKKAYTLTILFISHDLAVVDSFADRAIVLQNGEAVEEGRVGQVLSQAAASVYAGALECRAEDSFLIMVLHELLERQVQNRPNATALIFRGTKMSYADAELQDHVEKWASVLFQRGVKAGQRLRHRDAQLPGICDHVFCPGSSRRACGPGQFSSESR